MIVIEYIQSLIELIETLSKYDQDEWITPYIDDNLAISYVIGLNEESTEYLESMN